MKKLLFAMLIALVCAAILSVPVLGAAEGLTEEVSAPTEPVTWEYLVTIAGASLMTLLIVQFIKAPLDRVWKLPTTLVAYLIALGILTAAHAMTAGLDLSSFLLCLFNAFFSATSAMGMYEKTFRRMEQVG